MPDCFAPLLHVESYFSLSPSFSILSTEANELISSIVLRLLDVVSTFTCSETRAGINSKTWIFLLQAISESNKNLMENLLAKIFILVYFTFNFKCRFGWLVEKFIMIK